MVRWQMWDFENGRYGIVPKSRFVYFFWAIGTNLKTLFAPFPYNLTMYWPSEKELISYFKTNYTSEGERISHG